MTITTTNSTTTMAGPDRKAWAHGRNGIKRLETVVDQEPGYQAQRDTAEAEVRRLRHELTVTKQRARNAEILVTANLSLIHSLLSPRSGRPGWLRTATTCLACGCLLKPRETCPNCLVITTTEGAL